MKITEAWENRQEIIKKCRENNAGLYALNKLKQADNQVDFDNVLLSNFSWCIRFNILECWLPSILPTCTKLDCSFTQIKELPELPLCEYLYCVDTQIKELPELPVCKILDYRNTQIKELPELPVCDYLYK